MLLIRKNSQDGGGGKRCVPFKSNASSKLYQKGAAKLVVKRAPIMSGLTVPTASTNTRFQRPMLKRRAYGKSADVALKTSSLGPKRRFNGMAKLLARAGKPLTFKLPQQQAKKSSSDTEEESDEEGEDEKEDEKPFEPLKLWTSPHEGGECKGLAPIR